MSRVLVVEDDAAIRTVVAQCLRRAGHEVALARTLAEGEAEIARAAPDVLVTDVGLPDGDALERIRAWREPLRSAPVIAMSARNTLITAVRATEAGAFDYLPKPFDLSALTGAVAAALAGRDRPSEPPPPAEEALPLIGRSPPMQEVYRVIARVVATDLTVLITGESGTGKELVARALHDLGRRRAGPFVAINMAAIPRELIEAELFGHERGAFTGAAQRSAGRFEQASGGTLLLDEIGDMPTEAQTRLLRVLEAGEFTSVGGARPIRADVRVIAATHRDLAAEVASGRFREDLFYRLNVVPIALPPLRERSQDIPLLARHFLERAAGQGLPPKRLGEDAAAVLQRHGWPGNAREMENVMRRLAVLARGEVIGSNEVELMLGAPGAGPEPPAVGIAGAVRARLDQLGREQPGALEDGGLYDRIIGEVERPLIAATLARHGGNQLRAARSLGLNRNTLRKRLTALGLSAAGP